jgi:hypothetical protein
MPFTHGIELIADNAWLFNCPLPPSPKCFSPSCAAPAGGSDTSNASAHEHDSKKINADNFLLFIFLLLGIVYFPDKTQTYFIAARAAFARSVIARRYFSSGGSGCIVSSASFQRPPLAPSRFQTRT